MSGILKPFYMEPARHLYRLMTDRWYRDYFFLASRLSPVPRYQERTFGFREWVLSVPDCASLLSAFREIFVERIYEFKTDKREPYIVDLGANIGLSVLFFKSIYPDAEIDAFEADPQIYRHLVKNVHGNGHGDVRLFNKAAWHINTVLKFQTEGADGGRVADIRDGGCIEVEAIDIHEFMGERHVDFLKVDIEGAEVDVISGCSGILNHVDCLFVEYHSVSQKEQRLDELLAVLRSSGFRYHIHSMLESKKPFLQKARILDYDMLLNIFAWKE